MKKSILVTAAVAGMVSSLASGSAFAGAKKTANVACMGLNSCSGKGACKTASNECKGKNSCKGKGIVMKKSEEQCKKAGGTLMAMNDKKMDEKKMDAAPAAPAEQAPAAPATEAAPAH